MTKFKPAENHIVCVNCGDFDPEHEAWDCKIDFMRRSSHTMKWLEDDDGWLAYCRTTWRFYRDKEVKRDPHLVFVPSAQLKDWHYGHNGCGVWV